MTDDPPTLCVSSLPAGAWDELLHWCVSSHDEAAAARAAAAVLVGYDPADTSEGPALASAGTRVAMTLGELLANGLRHGDPPVRAALLRGQSAWLLVVSDAAVQRPPALVQVIGGQTRGGLGMRLVTSMADSAGWYTDGTRKHVWALIGDEAPQHLISALRPASRSDSAGRRDPSRPDQPAGPTSGLPESGK